MIRKEVYEATERLLAAYGLTPAAVGEIRLGATGPLRAEVADGVWREFWPVVS